MLGFGAPTSPAAGTSGSGVDATARAAAAAAQAMADEALETAENPIDLVARDAAAANAAAIGAIPGPVCKGFARFRRTTTTAFTDAVDENALINSEHHIVGDGFTVVNDAIVVGQGTSYLKISITEASGTAMSRSVRVLVNGVNVSTRVISLASGENMGLIHGAPVSAGDSVNVVYFGGSFTSPSQNLLHFLTVEAY